MRSSSAGPPSGRDNLPHLRGSALGAWSVSLLSVEWQHRLVATRGGREGDRGERHVGYPGGRSAGAGEVGRSDWERAERATGSGLGTARTCWESVVHHTRSEHQRQAASPRQSEELEQRVRARVVHVGGKDKVAASLIVPRGQFPLLPLWSVLVVDTVGFALTIWSVSICRFGKAAVVSDGEPYRRRIVDDELSELITELAAVARDGPKGVGKTRTALQYARTIRRLDDPAECAVAQAAPERLLDGEPPVLLDEWQRLPSVWDLVRRRVDEGAPSGSFLLTGSALPDPPPSHSGAGRIVSVRMRPFSLAERLENHTRC